MKKLFVAIRRGNNDEVKAILTNKPKLLSCTAKQPPKKDDGPMAIIKTIIICLILFFGVGFSIMSFNNDVSIDDMFSKISKQFTGDKEQGRKILEYCYSIGLGVGIIIFYNHFGPKKLTKDPTPIEVEMRKYERDINQTLIDGHNRDDGKVDVK